jgi:hypothetical protein
MPERRTHDDVRHGVTRLFAAFNIADGERDHLDPLTLPGNRVQEAPD